MKYISTQLRFMVYTLEVFNLNTVEETYREAFLFNLIISFII